MLLNESQHRLETHELMKKAYLSQGFHSCAVIWGHALIVPRCSEEIQMHLKRHWEESGQVSGEEQSLGQRRALGWELQPLSKAHAFQQEQKSSVFHQLSENMC